MQSNIFRNAVLCAAALFVASVAGAQQWQFVGTRAMGMGGAGVATAVGPDAQYWNPAGLAQPEDNKRTHILLDGGASLEATKDTLDGVRELTEMTRQYKSLKNAITSGNKASADNIDTLFKGLNNIAKMLGNDMGALAHANAGLGITMKNFAVGIRTLGTGAITPVVDTKRLEFYTGGYTLIGSPTATLNPVQRTAAEVLAAAIDANGIFDSLRTLLNAGSCANSLQLATALVDAARSYVGVSDEKILRAFSDAADYIPGASALINLAGNAEGSYKDNETLVMVDAATFAEAGLGYGQQVIPGLKVGGNFKVISGYTAQSGVMVLTKDEKIKEIFDKAYDNKKNSTNIGIDVGVMGNLSQLLDKEIFWNPQFGLTARNINSPRFARPDPPSDINAAIVRNWRTEKYELKPQLRAGVAVNPSKRLTAAADIDVTENDTLLDTIKSRQLALGLEFNVINHPRFTMPLRVGYNKNIAVSTVSPFYTAGIGFNTTRFHIELAGAMSTKSTKIDGKDIPNSAAGSLTIGFLF